MVFTYNGILYGFKNTDVYVLTWNNVHDPLLRQEKQFAKWYLICSSFYFYFSKARAIFIGYTCMDKSLLIIYQNSNSDSSFILPIPLLFGIIQSKNLHERKALPWTLSFSVVASFTIRLYHKPELFIFPGSSTLVPWSKNSLWCTI